MADIIYSKQDIPTTYKDEAAKYAELAVSNLTVTGAGSFTSNSSGSPVVYNYTSGTQDLFNQLDTILEDYRITGIDWKAVRSWIYGDGMPVLDGYREKINRGTDGKVSSSVLYTSSSESTKVAEQVITRGTDGKVSEARKYVYDSDGTTVLVDFTDTVARTDGKVTYRDRAVNVF